MTVVLCFFSLLCLCTSALGQIFEFADLDALSVLWQDRNNEINYKHETCGVDVLGERINGLCQSKVECLFSGGTPRGRCGVLSTCCTYERSCGRSTNARISYFTSAGNTFDTTICSYRVNFMNKNVCQIRLDFIEFDLVPPTKPELQGEVYNCDDEKFYAEPNAFTPMCGTNKGQHLYIHVPRSQQYINLYVKRARAQSRWNIRVTQLECGRSRDGRDVQSRPSDYPPLAPQGCLQYYTDASGTFRNFGYSGAYVGNQKYSICFRRSPNICGVKFDQDELQLSKDIYNNCKDYFFIPEFKLQECLNMNVNMKPAGPLYVTFYSGNEHDPGYLINFAIKYELIPC